MNFNNIDRQLFINKYIEDNHLPNATLLDYKDPKYFDIYDIDNVPIDIGLADAIFLNKDNKLCYSFLKGCPKDEMRLIVGDIGSGKSLRYLVPMIYLCLKRKQSMIVTDQCGELADYTYTLAKENDYEIVFLNFADTKKSNSYNPFYVEAKKVWDKKKVVTSAKLVAKSSSQDIITSISSKDPSWGIGSAEIVEAIILLLFDAVSKHNIKPEDVTIYNVINSFYWIVNEITNAGQNCVPLTSLEHLKTLDPQSECIQKMYAQFSAGGLTRSGYISNTSVDLSRLNNEYTFDITSFDSIQIKDLWEKPTIYYVITGGEKIGDIITKMLVDELIKEVRKYTYDKLDKALPIPIYLFFDEFPHIDFGNAEQFEEMVTTLRKHHIFINAFVQVDAQLHKKFDVFGTDVIKGNMSIVFLGSKDFETRKYISEMIGTHTYESIESIYSGGCPKLITSLLVPPEELMDMDIGEAYILRKGKDKSRVHTYFEGAFNIPLFTRSNEYLKTFKNKKTDYEDHLIVPSLLIGHTSINEVRLMDDRQLLDHIGSDIEKYRTLLYEGHINDTVFIKKMIKKGLLTLKEDKLIPTISKTRFEPIYGRYTRKHYSRFYDL